MLRIFSSGFSPVRIGSSSVASDSLETVLLSVLLSEEAVLEGDEDVVVPPLQAARERIIAAASSALNTFFML